MNCYSKTKQNKTKQKNCQSRYTLFNNIVLFCFLQHTIFNRLTIPKVFFIQSKKKIYVYVYIYYICIFIYIRKLWFKLNQFGNSVFRNKISVFEIALTKLSSKEINTISSHISEKLISSLAGKANTYQDGEQGLSLMTCLVF